MSHTAIEALLLLEESLEDQLDLLTAIAITTTCEETLKTTEVIRHALSIRDTTGTVQGNKTAAVRDPVESFGKGDTEWDQYSNEEIRRETEVTE